MGNRAKMAGLNLVGLKRRGFERTDISNLRKAYDMLFNGDETFKERLEKAEESFKDSAIAMDVISFIKSDSNRKICQPE
jgi:UDP-N-acetylglucosamine acyltransferase